nr:MAG TPA: hypothetical protein [Microviridae sp.]
MLFIITMIIFNFHYFVSLYNLNLYESSSY